jgi:hypothetical protein
MPNGNENGTSAWRKAARRLSLEQAEKEFAKSLKDSHPRG